ncbi:DUF3995 domain-containing protein [Oceanicola sp. 502str15]|uniref:DUF3995 domain-containing protein n=1 Tax=Oceanicola sp. 502str15 TaxID=2696061 RepID=UPI002094CF2E|nr:DUF3995 domain-containing protein [Oceanicola sp. 502str15]MCO6383182.1 DUF3995 domain-containing protein [Oceanicola sp. 502str15]
MTGLSLVLSAVLIVLAALHLMWALGWWFPLSDERALARSVVGARGIEAMPGAGVTSLVVVALLFAAAWPWMAASWPVTLGLAGLAGVFLLRGAVAYAPGWRRRLPEEPFATLDRRAFGPLCLALGAGFLILTYGALT